MKTIIELDEEDIKDIIAKLYNISIDNIAIYCSYEERGYGLNATEVPVVKIKIEKHDKII